MEHKAMKRIIVSLLSTLIIISNILPNTITGVNGYRNPLCLFSWDKGIVLDNEGNGMATTPFSDSVYNYIHYSNKNEGDLVFTLWMYNPLSLYDDDLIVRVDI